MLKSVQSEQGFFSDSATSVGWGDQGILKATVSCVFEDLKFKISAVSAKWAESGKHHFWSKPSEVLNLRSSNTQETVAFMPP